MIASRHDGVPAFVSLFVKNGPGDIYLSLTPAQAVELAQMLQQSGEQR